MQRLLLFIALLLGASVAQANSRVITSQDSFLGNTGGSKLSGAAINSTQYTGWIYVLGQSSVTFDIDLTDANASIAAASGELRMTCQTSRASNTTNGAGREVHAIVSTDSTGKSTSKPHTWAYPVTGTGTVSSSYVWSWTWVVTFPPAPWLNCALSASAGSAAQDTVSVYVRGTTP